MLRLSKSSRYNTAFAKGKPVVCSAAMNQTTSHFIKTIINDDLKTDTYGGRVVTRFPPHPNGFLHIGHAKSICLNFGLAEEYAGGKCHLRFDDTNPEKEDIDYINSIQADVQWLGFQWAGPVRYASDYFEQLYDYAVELVKQGKAYVCSLTADEAREYRGTLTEPGKNSPDRDLSIEENLRLLAAMRAGEFKDGERVLRAKIDMASPNINMRDPIMYRIRHATHHQTGDAWCIYPTYDFSHCLSDAIEDVTHSLCTLEFEDHRPLYDWFLDELQTESRPQQYEFARLNINYTITSKRKLRRLVEENFVSGWDDPRMPTIAGMRRRGYTPASLRNFCDAIGVARGDSVVDMAMLEHSVRDDLDKTAARAMCVMRPLKATLRNYPQDKMETLQLANHPKDESFGNRDVPFSRELYIDQQDFSEDPPRKWKRLQPGNAVRLRGAYVITCEEVIKDANGAVTELHCSFDADTLGKNPEGYKPNGVIHWVSAKQNLPVQVRLYDRLFTVEQPDAESDLDFVQHINPESLLVCDTAIAEQSVQHAKVEDKLQFEREGFFCRDRENSDTGKPVFNRVVSLRDSWTKKQ
ncbi:MAG: glutamine--tRNA ligase/YqeY domain fusion protein [Pseudomonadales bacterium]